MSGNNVNSALQQFITSLSGRNRSNDEHQFRREANNQLSVSADEPASQGSVQPSLSTPLMPIDDRQMDVDVPQDQVQETTSIAGNGGEEIPATANVSDNDSESESQMDADELEVQLQTTPDLSATTSSSSQPPSSLPSGAATPRGSRRGREHHDDDEDRDRRHPSQRTGPNPSSTAPDATTTPHTAPPPQTDGNHPAHGRSPLLGLTIDWPGGNLRPIPIRMGEGGGGLAALGISLDNLFARMGAAMGNVPEQEDPERAKRLVSALEEVPIGLVRRLERLSKFDDNGMVGDAGCAICWDKLIDESINVGWQSGEKRSSEAKSDDEEQRKIVALPCAHAFHAQCLVPWFSRPRQTTCPTCRFNIDPDNLSATPRRPRRRPSATNARTPPTNPLIPNDDTAVPNPPIIPSTIPTGPPPAEPSQPAIDQQVPGIGDDLPPNERQFFEQLLRRLGGRPSDAPTNPPPATDGQQQQPPPPAPPEGSNAHHVRLSGGPGVVIDVVSMVVGGPSPPGRAG
ncbi:hypothetical protein CYLTODRAFT_178940 [Cylindrobasidium torrendii FP15055 ss-10]|uniref:RING-type domain-containing protein n=1 Tax=Cylindrobasidium torrendii FP15055 ss-10 TaxID=1314674 RepID=A0A0D7BLS5_9AGAR|nr:hypothetical protein CYLTODRAFT_178940 [Cylindrobasidium torrendii FP15055 ss-10]